MSNILVTGATGHLGKAVIKYLLKKAPASSIKALVRDTSKASDIEAFGVELRVGDYGDRDALLKAFAGIDKLYLVSGSDLQKRGDQQQNAINAAKEAGVKHIIYTSIQRKTENANSPIAFLADSHYATEKALKESGLTYTILKDTLYTDVIPFFAGQQVIDPGTLNFPAGNGKTAFALREDMAEASANILLDDTGKYDNRSIPFTGAEAVSWADISAYISEVTGKKITFNSPDVAVYKSALTAANVPAEFVEMLAGFAQVTEQGEFEKVSPELEDALGRKPTTVKSYLQTVYQK